MSAMTRRLFSKGVTSVTCTAGRVRHSGGMKQLDIQTFHDFSDDEISRRILMENPVMRVVLVSMRAGQKLPEHAANGLVTVYAVSGHVLFFEGDESCDMVAGKLIGLAPGRPHRLEAKQDSRLLVTMIKQSDAAAWNALAPQGRTIDLRQTPRERRHSTVFYAFDHLAVGESFLLVNDHDPQPLHAQMEQLRPGELTWEYEVQGPNEFRIKISRVAISATPQPETVMAGSNH
jgi:uncharacterized protein (DUF2249 family)/quercetin dioxygenase-like cupin family protein